MEIEEAPMLSLRMKPTPLEKLPALEDALETLAVMTAQDVSYRARDYLGRRRKPSILLAVKRCANGRFGSATTSM